MKTLFALLLIIPSLSWGLDLRNLLEDTEVDLLTFGVFKINYQLNSNYDEIYNRTKSTISTYALQHFKKEVDLDNNMPAETLDVSSAVKDTFKVWDFNNNLKLDAFIDNEKNRLLIIYKVKYAISPFAFDDYIKKKTISKSKFFEEFDSEAFLNSFDSRTICRILRTGIQSELGFYTPSGMWDNDNNDYKMNTDYSYTDHWNYASFFNEYFTNEGKVWKDNVFKDYTPLQVDINVLAENVFKQENILCHGNAGDFNPSIVEYDIYTDTWDTGLYNK